MSLLDALEEDLLRPVRTGRARRVCDSGSDVQSVRTRFRFHVLSSESEDEDRALEPCVSQLADVDAVPTQVDDAIDVISGDAVDSTVGDAPEVQAETMRRPTVRRLVLVPQVGDYTPQSIQDRFSQSCLRSLDHVDLVHLFSIRAVVMKSPPKFVQEAYRAAMRIALEETVLGHQAQNEDRQSRGWKLFVLLPRMLLFRPPRRGLIPKQRIFDRFAAARKGSIRRRRTQTDSLEKRAERAQMLILMGKVSAGPHALDGAAVAPGTQDALNQLRRRPQVPREPVPPELMRSENLFNLDHDLFTKNLKCARRGAAGGLSGTTAEHVKPILDNTGDTELFCQVGEHLARGEIPGDVLHAIRMGRISFAKSVRGSSRHRAGDMVRRLVAKTIAQQIRAPVEVATAPFQHALSTRAGCECVAHALQALTDTDPRATILSVDGISAYDSISRVAMLRGLQRMEGGDALLPFVSQFYGSPSTYLWRTMKGLCTRSHKEKEGNRVTLSCLRCFLWGNTVHWKLSRHGCALPSDSWRFRMTSLARVILTGQLRC